jgi:hypothetical protein
MKNILEGFPDNAFITVIVDPKTVKNFGNTELSFKRQPAV